MGLAWESLLCVCLITSPYCRNDLCAVVSTTWWQYTPPYWKFNPHQKTCHGKSSSCWAVWLFTMEGCFVEIKKDLVVQSNSLRFIFDRWLLMMSLRQQYHVFWSPKCSINQREATSLKPTGFSQSMQFWYWFWIGRFLTKSAVLFAARSYFFVVPHTTRTCELM